MTPEESARELVAKIAAGLARASNVTPVVVWWNEPGVQAALTELIRRRIESAKDGG